MLNGEAIEPLIKYNRYYEDDDDDDEEFTFQLCMPEKMSNKMYFVKALQTPLMINDDDQSPPMIMIHDYDTHSRPSHNKKVSQW